MTITAIYGIFVLTGLTVALLVWAITKRSR